MSGRRPLGLSHDDRVLLARGRNQPPGKQCSLCGYVDDTRGRKATVPTRGGWVAHEECLAGCPNNGNSIRLRPGFVPSEDGER